MQLNKLSDKEFLSKHNPMEKDNHKLTDWKKEPTLKDLKRDLEQAQSNHSIFTSNLSKWEELFNPPKFGTDKHTGSRVVPKMVRKQAEWRCPALSEPFLSNRELFEVKPLTFEDVPRAKQNMLILNNQFNTQLDKVDLVDKVVRSVVNKGTAIIRLGWEYKEEKVKEIIPEFTYTPVPPEAEEQVMQQYEQLTQLQQTEPDSYEQLDEALKAGFEMSQEQQTLLVAKQTGEIEREVVKPIVNRPTVKLCNLRNVYVDPTCNGDLDEAQFVIYSYESSLSDLKKKDYKNLDKLKDYVETNPIGFDRPNNNSFNFADRARKKLVVYEYWGYWDIDGKGETKPITATWVGDTLIRMEENPFPDGKVPFVIFNYLPEEDSVYGVPDAELIEDNQNINAAITRGIIDILAKSANAQTGFSKGFLDATNKIRFKRGEDYEFNPQFHPQQHVYMHKYNEIPVSALNMIQMQANEAESISGVKAFTGNQGINAAYLGDTAAAARGVLDAVSKREMSILRRIAKGFIQMGRKIISMNAKWLNEEEVVRITNSEFIKVRRDDLAGNFDLELGIATAEEKDSKTRQLSFLLQTIGNNMGSGMMQMILSQIADLSNMPDLSKAILDYQEQPNELQQQMQQLELEYKQAEIELMKAQAQEMLAKSQVNAAKVNTEQARANNIQSDADNKTLDFAECDTGIKHDRDLEKQAMLNQGLIEQQQLKNEGLSQQVADKHNAQLLQQFAQQDLQPKNIL